MTTEAMLKKELAACKKALAKAEKPKIKRKPTAANKEYASWYAKHGKSYPSCQVAMKAYWAQKRSMK